MIAEDMGFKSQPTICQQYKKRPPPRTEEGVYSTAYGNDYQW